MAEPLIHAQTLMAQLGRDGRQFTETALGFSMTLLNAGIDLISFSGILYSIYPPLFIALLVYSIGGTAVSIRLGKPLVGLNFQQEAKEANFRCAASRTFPASLPALASIALVLRTCCI